MQVYKCDKCGTEIPRNQSGFLNRLGAELHFSDSTEKFYDLCPDCFQLILEQISGFPTDDTSTVTSKVFEPRTPTTGNNAVPLKNRCDKYPKGCWNCKHRGSPECDRLKLRALLDD